MAENVIEDWLKNDETLSALVNEINASGKDIDARALEAFHRISELYELPKYPGDYTAKDFQLADQRRFGPACVFEEATMLKYLEPDQDPWGLVMLALYNIRNGKHTDFEECAKKHFGSTEPLPNDYLAGFIGDGFAGRLRFVTPNKAWFVAGARSAMRSIG
jgi:hypothetical protein